MKIDVYKNSALLEGPMLDGFDITTEFGGRTSTFTFSIQNLASEGSPVDFWDFIEVFDNPGGTKQFAGYVTRISRTNLSMGPTPRTVYEVVVQDFMLLLDKTIVPTVSISNQPDNTSIVNIFNTYIPSIDTSGVSFVSNITINATQISLRSFMERVVESTQAHFYITPDGVLYYHSPASSPAPFSLAEDYDGVSSFGFERKSFRFEEEFSAPCNKCTVIGVLSSGSTPISQTYQDATSQSLYGVRERVITDRTVTTDAEALAKATAVVQEFAYPRSQGTVTFWEDGAKAGDLLTISAPSYGCDDDFRINRLRMRWNESKTRTWYEAEFGEFRPDLVKTLRKIEDLASGKADTPIATPSDSSVKDASLLRTGGEKIQITNTDIVSLSFTKVTDVSIENSDIVSVDFSKVTNVSITDSDIVSVSFSKVTSVVINDSDIGTIHAGSLIFSGESLGIDSGISYTGTGTFTISSSGGLNLTSSGGMLVSGGTLIISSSGVVSIVSSLGFGIGAGSQCVIQCLLEAFAGIRMYLGNFVVGSTTTIDSSRNGYFSDMGSSSGYKVGATRVIDSSRNLSNIGNITGSGHVSMSGYVSGSELRIGGNTAVNISVQFVGSGGVNTSGTVNCTGYQVSSTTVIDGSRNMINIGNYASSGYVWTTSYVRADTGYRVGGSTGQSGTFTTTDGKTITVTSGIITSIV